jgi:hypothetical protein
MITNLCQEVVMDSGMFYAPYIPVGITGIKPYSFIRKVDDVNEAWYTIKIHHPPAVDWMIEELPIGSWRYAANTPLGGWVDLSVYDLREDAYSWFTLRWS